MDGLKTGQERLAKGEITENQLQNWSGYTLGNYEGVGTKDPVTGSYKLFQPDAIAKYVDSYKSGEDIAKEMEPFVDGRKVTYTNGRYFITEGTEIKELPASFIQQAVGNKLMQDVQWQNYMRQSVLHATGMEPTAEELESYAFDSVGATIGQAFQRKDVKYERDMKNDSEYLLRLRRKWDIEDMEAAREPFRPETAPAGTLNTIFGQQSMRIPYETTVSAPLDPVFNVPGLAPSMQVRHNTNAFKDFATFADENAPKIEAMKGFYNQVKQRVLDNPKYKTDKDRNKGLATEWNAWLDSKTATLGATDIVLPKETLLSRTEDQWKGLLLGEATKIFEVKNGRVQGSANENIKRTKGKVIPLKFSAQGPELGIKFRDEESGKEYVAVGALDAVTNELKDVQNMFSPLLTGEVARTRLPAGPGAEMHVESSVGGTLDNPGLQLRFVELRRGKDGKLQRVPRGEITNPQRAGEWVNDLMISRSSNAMKSTNLHPNYTQYGDTKGLFDKKYVDQMDKIE